MKSPAIFSPPAQAVRKGSRGFTLIELLVVIAIIAILAAILFPVFARARENARRSSCQSNLKQTALGVFQYTQDYDEKFIPLRTYNTSTGEVVDWNFTIQPYLKSNQLLVCPSNTGADAAATNRISYGMNVTLNTNPNVNTMSGISLAAINYPSELMMLVDDDLGAKTGQCDGYGLGSIPNSGGYGYVWWDPTGSRGGTSPITVPSGFSVDKTKDLTGPDARHLGGANAAYADGHVKWVKFDNLYVPPSGTSPVTNWRAWYVNAP